MKWSIHQLRKFHNQDLEINEVLNLSSIKKQNSDIREVSPININGNLDYDKDKITVHLHITGQLTLACSRTLLNVEFPIDIKAVEVFHLSSNNNINKIDEHYLEGDVLDLLPIIESYLLTEIPIQIFSNEIVKEEMLHGNGWQVIKEKEVQDQIDPRLKSLSKLLKKD